MSATETAEAERAQLGRSASSSALTVGAGQVARFLIQTTGIIALARLLSPGDYGVLAAAVVISGVGEMLRDFGLAHASVQAATLTRAERDNLFWVNSAMGIVLAAGAFVVAPFVGDLFGDDRVGDILRLLAIGLVLSGVATQPRASLVRSMRFLALNVIDTVALTLGVTTGLLLALLGAGYWSLGAMLLAQSVAALVGVLVTARWRPGLPHRSVSIRSLVGFGAGLFGSQLLNYLTKNANTLVIGLSLGVTPLGLYNRAYQLLNLPLAQIQAPATQLALPVLSRLRDEPERFERFLLRGQSILIHITTLVLASTAGLAGPLFGIVLGRQWVAAALVYQILAVSGFAMVASYAAYWVFLAEGKTRSHLRMSLVTQPATLVAVAVGAWFGLYGIVIAFAVVNALIWPFTLYWLSRISSVSVSAMLTNGIRPIVGYGSAGVAAWLATVAVAGSDIVDAFAGAGVFLVVLGGWLACWPRLRHDLLDIARLARHLRKDARP